MDIYLTHNFFLDFASVIIFLWLWPRIVIFFLRVTQTFNMKATTASI